MKKIIFIVLGTMFIIKSTAYAEDKKQGRNIASKAFSVEYRRGEVNKSALVKQISAYAKMVSGKNAKCSEPEIEADPTKTTVVVRGNCNIKELNKEFSVLFEIKGTVYFGYDGLLIDEVKFEYVRDIVDQK